MATKNNDFRIVISATDKATASIRRINDSISKMTQPFDEVQRSMASLGKELGRNPVVKGLKSVERAAESVAAGVAKIAAPMAALIGVGSIAGLGMLVTEWGRLGFEISKTSSLLGTSTSALQSLRGAAQLAGLSSEELTSGLGTLRQNLQDAKWGRNPALAGLMNRLRMSLRMTADGSVDVVRGLRDVSRAISTQSDIGAKHTIAQAFGVEALLPLLMKGEQGIAALEKRASDLGAVLGSGAVEQARRYGESLNEMSVAADGLKIAIGSELLPVMAPLVQHFTALISQNRQAISERIGGWAKKLGDYIEHVDFDRLEHNIEVIGGAIGTVADKVADLLDKFDRLKAVNPAKYLFGGVPRLAYDLLTGSDSSGRSAQGRIASPSMPGSAAPIAPARSSSDLPRGLANNNPGNLRHWGSVPNVGGYAAFSTPAAGLQAMAQQLALYGMRGNDTIAGIVSKWAPPGDNNPTGAYIGNVSKQTGFKPGEHLNLSDSGVLSSLMAAMIRQENGQQPYGKDMIQTASKQAIELTLHGLPHGATATAKAKGSDVPVRVAMGMPRVELQ